MSKLYSCNWRRLTIGTLYEVRGLLPKADSSQVADSESSGAGEVTARIVAETIEEALQIADEHKFCIFVGGPHVDCRHSRKET